VSHIVVSKFECPACRGKTRCGQLCVTLSVQDGWSCCGHCPAGYHRQSLMSWSECSTCLVTTCLTILSTLSLHDSPHTTPNSNRRPELKNCNSNNTCMHDRLHTPLHTWYSLPSHGIKLNSNGYSPVREPIRRLYKDTFTLQALITRQQQ